MEFFLWAALKLALQALEINLADIVRAIFEHSTGFRLDDLIHHLVQLTHDL